jgi:hypothetical protein
MYHQDLDYFNKLNIIINCIDTIICLIILWINQKMILKNLDMNYIYTCLFKLITEKNNNIKEINDLLKKK